MSLNSTKKQLPRLRTAAETIKVIENMQIEFDNSIKKFKNIISKLKIRNQELEDERLKDFSIAANFLAETRKLELIYDELNVHYNELLNAVTRINPDKTKHQTILEHIKEMEFQIQNTTGHST